MFLYRYSQVHTWNRQEENWRLHGFAYRNIGNRCIRSLLLQSAFERTAEGAQDCKRDGCQDCCGLLHIREWCGVLHIPPYSSWDPMVSSALMQTPNGPTISQGNRNRYVSTSNCSRWTLHFWPSVYMKMMIKRAQMQLLAVPRIGAKKLKVDPFEIRKERGSMPAIMILQTGLLDLTVLLSRFQSMHAGSSSTHDHEPCWRPALLSKYADSK